MSAIISDCGLYRYRLERVLAAEGPTVAFVMVNPSTADAEKDDPTIRKCMGFAKIYHAGRLIVGNKFAFRATDVNELRRARDPIGPDNDRHLGEILAEAHLIFVAWGALSKLPEVLRGRWKDIVRIADSINRDDSCDLLALGVNADGHPRHPLMTAYDTPGLRWTVPWFAGRRGPSVSPAKSQPDENTGGGQ